MEFEDENGSTWWRGLVTQYDPTGDQYAAFFPSDNTTIYFKAEDGDNRILYIITTIIILKRNQIPA